MVPFNAKWVMYMFKLLGFEYRYILFLMHAGHGLDLNLVAHLQLATICPILMLCPPEHLHFAEQSRDWPEGDYFDPVGQRKLVLQYTVCELKIPVFCPK